METSWTVWILVWAIGAVIVHGAFAYGVAVDSHPAATHGKSSELAPRWAWILATVVMGPVLAVLYWLVHRSRLSVPVPVEAAGPDPLAELFKRSGKKSSRRRSGERASQESE